MKKNNIINKNQFGFQKKKSAVDAVIVLTEKINEIVDKGELGMTIFLDLAKAFNSISHTILLQKISNYGYSENAIELLKSFLTDRKQRVRIGSKFSNWLTINHGVPQGTVLGPLIFILYVNDFQEQINTVSNVLQFADDTGMICQSKEAK